MVEEFCGQRAAIVEELVLLPVVFAKQSECHCLATVIATGPPRLLVIVRQRFRVVVMNDQRNPRVVDPHPESLRRHHDLQVVRAVGESVERPIPSVARQLRVVRRRPETVAAQTGRQTLAGPRERGIDDRLVAVRERSQDRLEMPVPGAQSPSGKSTPQ